MLGNYQRYEVTVTFAFESEVFPGDPTDVYELAELEKPSVENALQSVFDELEIDTLKVEPVIIATA